MVLGQFVTTYRKDYLWPYVRTFGTKPEPSELYSAQYQDANLPLRPCHCMHDKPDSQNRDVFGPSTLQQQEWTRLGPMGPLLDPKLYPARVGASPEVDSSRFNQPNVFLKKLQEKYPYIYEVLRTAPPDELISRINRDRLRTTYQVDYCKMNEYPSAPYDELLRTAGVEGLPPCPEPLTLPGDPCRPNQKPVAFRPTVFSGTKQTRDGRGEGGGNNNGNSGSAGSCSGGLPGVTPGATEYQDAISRLGHLIIRDKIHLKGRPNTIIKG